MKKSHLKLIMELIFIFILPLIFICFTSEIQIEREFTYDNQGNYEISQDKKNLSFDNSIIKYIHDDIYINYLNFNQLYNYNYSAAELNNNGTTIINNFNYSITIDNTPTERTVYYIIETNANVSCIENHKYLININDNTITGINYGLYLGDWFSLESSNIFTCSNDSYLQFWVSVNSTYNGTNTIFINIIDLTEMYGLGYEPTITEYNNLFPLNNYEYTTSNQIIIYSDNIISSNHRINYTIWGNIKQLIIDNLDLNDNVLLDIVLCYTTLWLVMFLIWHLIYGFLELIFHIIPKRWERDFE